MRNSQRLMRAMKVGVAALALAPSLAFAQDGNADETKPESDDEIVVTGTLIRGVQPVGSNVLSIGSGKLEEVGAASANQALASIPQVTNFFNRVPAADLAIAVNQVQVARPRIRNIGNEVSASSPTLVIYNGHRIAGAGVTVSSVDPDILPGGAIERMDVMTEGGSATYGADAVAGVINIITMRKFDGLKVNANFGIADNYKQWSVGATFGKDWGSGSAFVSYSYDYSDILFGRDRDFVRDLDYSKQPYQGRNLTCAKPNLTLSTFITAFNVNIGTVPYAAPNFVANTANRCDNSQNSTIVPRSKRHGAFFGLTQELDDTTSIDVHAFYGQRSTFAQSEAVGTVALGPLNPAATAVNSAGLVVGPAGSINLGFGIFPLDNRALVQFSFSPALGLNPLTQTTGIKEGGLDIELTHDFSSDWQYKQLVAWSKSKSNYNLQSVSTSRLNAAGAASTPSTAINPFNVAATNPGVLASIIDNELAGETKNRLLQIRGILEGRLFTLPGGDVRMAVGYEYLDEFLQKRQLADIPLGTLKSAAFTQYDRTVLSGFGELRVPLVGDDNSMPGIHSLLISLAGRWDHYSDFGSTTNPKIGVTYEPVKGLRIRGNWGKSFTAPNAIDQLGGLFNTIGVSPFVSTFQPVGNPAPTGSYSVVIQGSNTPLKPQRATTWSVGADIDPFDGLHLSGNYYHIDYRDQLGIPDVSSFANFFVNNPSSIVMAPGSTGIPYATVNTFANRVPNANVAAQLLTLQNSGAVFYSLVDFRTGNFYVSNLSGVDFSASYRHQTGFGSFDLSAYGNVRLKQKEQNSPTAVAVDKLALGTSKFTFQLIGGIDIGSFRAQATWNHTHGYSVTPTTSVPVQTRVGSFNTVDLFFKYDVPGDGMFKDLSLTMNVRNLLDEDPPVFLGNTAGYVNGFTLGRMFMFGASKKF